MKHYFIILFLITAFLSANAQTLDIKLENTDILISDFEGDAYMAWENTGDAFAKSPVKTSVLLKWGDNGFEGKNLATSFSIGDAGTGSFTSPEFTIQRKYINFLIGGGANINDVYVALLIDGKEVKRSAGFNRRVMVNEHWDVSSYNGRKARIRIVDNSKEGWGFINADFFYQSDKKKEKETVTRKIKITDNFLNFPVRTGATIERMEFFHKNNLVHDMEIELDGDNPDFWVNLNCEQWKGKEIELCVPVNGNIKNCLAQIYQSNSPNGKEGFYKESLRPKIHYTSQRGWLNDPNGLVWYKGEWHLFYQHNPYGVLWNNMTWGHAVSHDLVHWKELGDVMHPDKLGPIFSGSAVVDKNNTLGVKKDNEETLVSIYTSAGGVGFMTRNLQHSQSIAYSTDKGRTWEKYADNPVIPTIKKFNRDPKVIWHEQRSKWVMALFLDANEYALFTSTDLKNWIETDRFVLDGADECPDFFEIQVEGKPGKNKWVFTGANSTYLIGDFDGNKFRPQTKPKRMDSGTNYYAVQTYSNAPDNRRIQIAWMNGSSFPGMPFNQQMSFPRELKLYETGNGYSLRSMPVREIENLYKGKHEWNDMVIGNENITSTFGNPVFHLKSSFKVDDCTSDAFGFNIDNFIIKYLPDSEKLTVSLQNGKTISEFQVTPVNGNIELDIISDIGSIEFFANRGEKAGAYYYLPENRNGKVKVFSDGGIVRLNSLIIHDLSDSW